MDVVLEPCSRKHCPVCTADRIVAATDYACAAVRAARALRAVRDVKRRSGAPVRQSAKQVAWDEE